MWRLILAIVIFGELVLVLWATGKFADFGAWVLASQRDVQTLLAGAIRALRSGDLGALAGFLGICFAYGVLHAAGPGHGKLVIGGYGLARRVTARKLAVLSVVSSLAQAVVAVAAVYAIVAGLGLSRQVAGGVVDSIMAPLGSAAIAALGLYLVWRGVRGLRAQMAAQGHHDHDHHNHGPDCGCGHAHGPTPAQAAQAQSPREVAALIAGIALRPCTGAVFVLILTWQLGIGAAGIAGAFAMGLGTAAFTAAVALLSVFAREGAFGGLGLGQLARVLPWAEVFAGGMIAIGAGVALAAAI
jgi:ABC-type nickel/cobalt efflux system permease component RcnA